MKNIFACWFEALNVEFLPIVAPIWTTKVARFLQASSYKCIAMELLRSDFYNFYRNKLQFKVF